MKEKEGKPIPKTHNYEILKTYTLEEIKAHGDAEFFMDGEITDRRIKLRRAKILHEIGYECVDKDCNIHGCHFAVGKDAGGGIHLDLYGYDEERELMMITIDHIKPKSKGGPDDISNYAPLCKVCNELKADDY